MFKHMLIPTDGSTLSGKALKRGIALAKRLKTNVTVVYVFTPFAVGLYGDMGMGYETLEQQMREFGRKEAKKYLGRAQAIAESAGVKINRLVVEDALPWRGIIGMARKKRCDVILMGARGRGAVSTALLGSQTNAVLAHSKIPVLVYR